jgi:hypothetical protein
VTDSDKAELRKFIETEIALGFTLKETALLSHSEEHKKQALDNASAAYDTASRFIRRLSADEIDPAWEPRLAELLVAIHS